MPIIKEHNTIFIHIPKTGGTTVLRMFGIEQVTSNDMFYHIDEVFEYDHSSALLIKSKAADTYNSFYKFTLVRNPYDRLVSEYTWKIKDKDVRSVDVEGKSFEYFVEYVYENFDMIKSQIHREKSHLIPQSEFVLDDVNVFKFEEIDKCLQSLSDRFNLPIPQIKFNATNHNHYSFFYNKKLYSMVYDIYYNDFKMFGYDKIN